MRKLLTFLAVSTLALFLVPVAFGAANVSKNIDRDLNAFASGTTSDGASNNVNLALDVNKIPNPLATLTVFVFIPSSFTFDTSTETLGQTEYQFADTNSAGVTHTWAGGPFAGVTFDVDWTAAGDPFRGTVARIQAVQDPTLGNMTFIFSAQSVSRPASVSGTGGATCCTFGGSSINRESHQDIEVIRP